MSERDKEYYINAGICAEISIINEAGKDIYHLSDNYGATIGFFETLQDAKDAVPDYLTLDPTIRDYRL